MYGHKDGWRNKIIGKGHFAPKKRQSVVPLTHQANDGAQIFGNLLAMCPTLPAINMKLSVWMLKLDKRPNLMPWLSD